MKPLSTVIETVALSKSFGDFNAVDKLSFKIEKGDVYGFLGENGAGKSTTMRMLLGLIKPTSGSIKIMGEEFNFNKRSLLKHVGAIIERPDMYGYLSAWDNLKIFSKMSGVKVTERRQHEVLEMVQLIGREKDKVKTYSQGMKQRLGIAIAMVHNPALLILDEPTNGLDPQGIAEMRSLIRTLSEVHGRTILISSHLLHEIEQVANKMIIIHKGKKMAEGRVDELLNPEDTLIEIKTEPSNNIKELVSNSKWSGSTVEVNNEQIVLKLNPTQVPELNEWLVHNGLKVLSLSARHSLEDYFLSLTTDATTTTGAL